MRKLALAALCIGLVVVIGPLATAKPRIASTVSLQTKEEDPDFVFRGRVRSDKPACERNRRVRITAGNVGDVPPEEEGVVKTDESGRYELRVPQEFNTLGHYKATALKKTRPGFICRVARSEVVN